MAEKAQLKIHKGADDNLIVGNLRFEACRREIELVDGGITLRVFLDQPNVDETELLRFDCFRDRPHYHAPGENQKETVIEKTTSDVGGWIRGQIQENFPALLDQGGFLGLAKTFDTSSLAGVDEKLEALMNGLAEPSETSFFEVDAAVLRDLQRANS